VAAEHLLDGLRIEALEDIADRGMSGELLRFFNRNLVALFIAVSIEISDSTLSLPSPNHRQFG
jgi:hypothetical protein